MSTPDSCKDGASKSNDDEVCEVNDMLHNMSTADKDVPICANCGRRVVISTKHATNVKW